VLVFDFCKKQPRVCIRQRPSMGTGRVIPELDLSRAISWKWQIWASMTVLAFDEDAPTLMIWMTTVTTAIHDDDCEDGEKASASFLLPLFSISLPGFHALYQRNHFRFLLLLSGTS